EDALVIRRRLLLAFETAERVEDDAERQALLTFVVVGAGATGVEMAGAIAELARHTPASEIRHIEPRSARVLLVEAGPRILGGFAPTLATYAHRALQQLGVEIRLHTRIDAVDARGVIAGGERIDARVVVWGAGVKATPVAAWLGVEANQHG